MGSTTESLISILYCPSIGAPRPRSEEWGRNARGAAARQTGDVESRGRQLHKDRHGAAVGVGGGGGTVKSDSVR